MPNALAVSDTYDDGDDSEVERDDVVEDAQEAFALIRDVERENRDAYKDDFRFAALGEQWPDEVRAQRERDGRPCLTTNLLPAFIRQVVNDARQNKPSIQVHPNDSQADPEVADILSGLVRNIESVSKADIAYDTGLECACRGGWGYWTVSTEHADDDSFDLDLRINAVPDPLTIYGDPYSTGADSADWNSAFETELMDRAVFKRRFKGAAEVDWADYTRDIPQGWMGEDGKRILVAKWWQRREVMRTILQVTNGDQTEIVAQDEYKARREDFDAGGFRVVGSRKVPSHEVSWTLCSGAEELDSGEWGGRYIPIVPVYGDVVWLEGRRHLRSMIRDAKDPARMANYWDTTATETIALAPKAPFIGPEEAFRGKDASKWDTANTDNHAFISFKGAIPPQRQQAPPIPSGALEMKAAAMDAMRRVIGIHDPNLGVQGDATSGKMLIAEQRKGDTSNFHFSDNQARAVAHTGRILVDLIPLVYPTERIVRTLGLDGKPQAVKVNAPTQVPQTTPDGKPVMGPQPGPDGQPQVGPDGQPVMGPVMLDRLYDLSTGKYDVTVRTGPAFGTQREEQAQQMIQLATLDPLAAPVLLPFVVEALDFHGADKIKAALEAKQSQPDPKAAQAQQQLQLQAAQAQQEQQLELQRIQAEGQMKANIASQQASATLQIEQQKLAQQVQIEQAKWQQEAQLAQAKAAFEADLATRKLNADIAIKATDAANRIQAPPVTDGVEFGGEPG